jgi:hypothetical protein
VKVAAVAVLALAACGGGDLPPLALTTPHVRYHARAAADVPAGAGPWLEDFRTDLLTYFGALDAQRDTVIDYYVFDDQADLVNNTPCPTNCTSDPPVSVYTSHPLDDYELVHGFLSPLGGIPPYLIGEGTARAVSCYVRPPSYSTAVANWQDLIAQGDTPPQFAYGERVVPYLLDRFGPERFIAYYAGAHFTTDPGLFALEFERSFGVTFASVWDAALAMNGPLLKPICPCELEPLALGSSLELEYPGHAFYRPVNVPDGASLSITFARGSTAELQDCRHESLDTYLVSPNPTQLAGANVAVVKLTGDNYLRFDRRVGLTAAPGDWIHDSCSTEAPVAIAAGTVGLTVVAPHPGAAGSFFVGLSVEGARQVALSDAGAAAFVTIDVCSDCGLTTCTRLDATPRTVSGDGVLVIKPAPPAQGALYAGISVSFG